MTTTLARSGLSSKDRKRIKRLHLFLFGPYKSGKTIAAHCMPRTRTLDFDDGMQSVEWGIKEGVIPKKLEEIAYTTMLPQEKFDKDFLNDALAQVDEWIDEEDIPAEEWDKPYPQKWDTLIVDSMSPFNESVVTLALAENNRLNLSKSWEGWKKDRLTVRPTRVQDYGAAANLTLQFVTELRKLPKNIVITAHQYNDTDDDGNILSIQPLLIGQARSNVPALFDEVWYAHTAGSKEKTEFLFQTLPGAKRICGSRLGCLEAVETADFIDIKKRVAAFYGVSPDWLWSAAHGRIEVEKEQASDLQQEGARV